MILSLHRLGAILRKEFIQMRRDRVTFAMMLVVPLMQLLLFGFAINNDPRHLPTAFVSPVEDRFTQALSTALEVTGYFDITHADVTAEAADRLLARGDVSFAILIPPDFGRKILRGDRPQVLVEADAADPAASSGAVAALGRVANGFLARETGTAAPPSIEIVAHNRYNPEGIMQYNIVPGLLGVILQMTLVMMAAMALTREIERGTMENLLAMPATPAEIMVGKITPFIGIGAVQGLVVLGAAKLIFGVPFVGSALLLFVCVLLFVLALVLLGYLISTVARTQMQAMQLSIFIFLPSVLLSGFMFPFRGMPEWAQWLGEVLPITHLLRMVRAVMLKGAEPADIAAELLALLVMVAVLCTLALLRFRRTLD
jgi:ABC-2 type transport system permease protein